MLTIGQVASRSGLRASAIRYYEAQGLLPRPSRQAGRRIYPTSVLQLLAVIELAKAAGFELAEVRALMSEVHAADAAPAWRKLVPKKALEIDAHMKSLRAMKSMLARLSACRCATLEQCGRAFIEARAKQPPHQRLQPTALSVVVKRRG
jgi:MerR family transcriptional regulator, redox-sensitive transcriptional activator SoxR